MMGPLTQLATEAPLATYAYSYPHKSSYRPLSPPVKIAEAWQNEDQRQLSLYVHLPFCEMRCGFCNLFTQSQPTESLVDQYLAALQRQMRVIRHALPQARFVQFAVGGGTPTFLSAAQLTDLFAAVDQTLGHAVTKHPVSVEASPATITADRVQVLADYNVQRLSLGVQSFHAGDARLFGRPQDAEQVSRAIEIIRAAGDFELNLDLMYGHQDQSRSTWLQSVETALAFAPDELYLYPLYVRPQTGLAQIGCPATRHRSDLYRAARDCLLEQGYRQISLRCFRRQTSGQQTAYACQRDGMIGLGCGARSYTRQLHYGTRFAVTQPGIRAIIQDWISQTDPELEFATHGVWLSEEEQIRRYVILTLLQAEGMSLRDFADEFPGVCFEDLTGVSTLRERGWLQTVNGVEQLTELGLEHSDEVGPLLYSEAVRTHLRSFVSSAAQEADQ